MAIKQESILLGEMKSESGFSLAIASQPNEFLQVGSDVCLAV